MSRETKPILVPDHALSLIVGTHGLRLTMTPVLTLVQRAPSMSFENGDWSFQGRFCCLSPMISVIRAGNVRRRPYDIKLWVE